MSERSFKLGAASRNRSSECSASAFVVSVDPSAAGPISAMTSQGSAHGRFTRAIERRDLFQAELALLAEEEPEPFTAAAVHWHGRLELEAPTLTLTE